MISREELENLAQLARLRLSEAELAELQKDISSILAYVGQVSAFSAGAPEKKAGILRNVLRTDVAHTTGSILQGKREALLQALPRREGDFAVVRKILHKDD